MNHHTVHLVRTIIGIIGNVISLFLFLSPSTTIKRIWRNKSVEEFHPYIYIAGIFNCCLWVLYGSPSVHPDSTLVWTINSVGLVLYAAYIFVFFIYAPRRQKCIVGGLVFLVAVAMVAISVPNLELVHNTSKKSTIIGALCIVVNIGLYAAPLTIMAKVIKTRSNEFLPFWVCLANLANGCIWTIYSLLPFDLNIFIGNATGTVLAISQLVLYWYFSRYNCIKVTATASEVQLQNKMPA